MPFDRFTRKGEHCRGIKAARHPLMHSARRFAPYCRPLNFKKFTFNIGKPLEFECITARIEQKHSGLLAYFVSKTNVGLDDKLNI